MLKAIVGAATALVITGAGSGAMAATGPVTPQRAQPAPLTSNFVSGVTAYSDATTFAGATSGLVTDGFQNVATGSNGQDIANFGSPVSGGTGLYVDSNGTTFSAMNSGYNSNLAIEGTQYGTNSNGSYGAIGNDFASDVLSTNYNALTISFAAPVTAFGINYGALARAFAATTAPDTFTFTIAGLGSATEGADGLINTGSFMQGGTGFFGVTSTTAFSSITINGTGTNNVFFDNVSSGAATAAVSAAPEPGAWALMLGGVGAMGMMLRRRRSAALTA